MGRLVVALRPVHKAPGCPQMRLRVRCLSPRKVPAQATVHLVDFLHTGGPGPRENVPVAFGSVELVHVAFRIPSWPSICLLADRDPLLVRAGRGRRGHHTRGFLALQFRKKRSHGLDALSKNGASVGFLLRHQPLHLDGKIYVYRVHASVKLVRGDVPPVQLPDGVVHRVAQGRDLPSYVRAPHYWLLAQALVLLQLRGRRPRFRRVVLVPKQRGLDGVRRVVGLVELSPGFPAERAVAPGPARGPRAAGGDGPRAAPPLS